MLRPAERAAEFYGGGYDHCKANTQMNIEEVLGHPAFWIVVAAASELIGMSKLKDNSVVQLLFTVLRSLKAKKG